MIEIFHNQKPAGEIRADGEGLIIIRFKAGPTWEQWSGTLADLFRDLKGPIKVDDPTGQAISLDPRVEIGRCYEK